MDIYMSATEAELTLRVTSYILRGLVFDKKLETVRVAGTTCFYRADIEKYAAKHGIVLSPAPTYEIRQAPPAPPPNLVYGLPGGSTQETTV